MKKRCRQLAGIFALSHEQSFRERQKVRWLLKISRLRFDTERSPAMLRIWGN